MTSARKWYKAKNTKHTTKSRMKLDYGNEFWNRTKRVKVQVLMALWDYGTRNGCIVSVLCIEIILIWDSNWSPLSKYGATHVQA
jgi:hypothetical protein